MVTALTQLAMSENEHMKIYIIPATSSLFRHRITVSVSSSSNQSIQQHRQAISDTQDDGAHVHLPHGFLHCLSASGRQVLIPVPNMLNSGTIRHQMTD